MTSVAITGIRAIRPKPQPQCAIFAIDKLRMPQLISLIRVGNNASKRVAEKIGMRCDAEIIRNGAGYWQYSINSTSKES